MGQLQKIIYKLTLASFLPIFLFTRAPLVTADAVETVQATPVVNEQLATANDPFFTTQANDQNMQWYLPKSMVPQAWDYGRGSSSVIVAVLDTGIHASHVDLDDGRVIAGFNAITNQPIAANSDSDDNGHGTLVAGVIGAIANNAVGISGINWNISIMPVKVLDSSGNGTIPNIVSGIKWATDHGANIINMSLGGSGFDEDANLAAAISYAFNKGVVIVAASGNDTAAQGLDLDQSPVYPVCADNGQNMVIGVAASDLNDQKAPFSNYGINCVDVTAPGVRILTTAYLPSNPSDNLLIYGDGTSLAAPVVSGIAALVKSDYPALTNTQIRDDLINTSDNIDALNPTNCLNTSCSGFLGHGRINALSAVSPKALLPGSLVRSVIDQKIYYINNNTKEYVSNFVFQQRAFSNNQIITDTNNALASIPAGPALPPLDGTLIKSQSDPTVYIINGQVKRPLTYLVFTSRNFSFSNVNALPDADVSQIATGDWYWPPDGTLVLISGNPTVYVMNGQVARPVTYFVFNQRKLSFANVIKISNDDFLHIPRPADAFWLPPLDGTLVKSAANPTVYVITNGQKHGLSGAQFAANHYRFSDIKVLPQAEMDVIAPGDPII